MIDSVTQRLRNTLLAVAFALTGMATALLGAALPAMLAEWHLSDSSGGWLLFSAFAGSTTGASLVQGAFGPLAAAGLAVTALGTFGLCFLAHGPLFVAFLLYGLGLGITMTAISFLRSREVEAGQSNVEMNRLNLLWALGACCAPALALSSLRLISVNALFRWETASFAVAAVSLFVVLRGSNAVVLRRRESSPHVSRIAPWRMSLFAAAAVGLESAIGSWLTTYTQRVTHGTGTAVSANSAFWIGLLLSRAAHSVKAGPLTRLRSSVVAHLAAVAVSTFLLILLPHGTVLPFVALAAGLGLGPLYPFVLSVALPRYRSSIVFVMAGLGAAVLPWLTGMISGSFHSLRAGLLAPAATVFLLLGSALWMRREIRAPDPLPS